VASERWKRVQPLLFTYEIGSYREKRVEGCVTKGKALDGNRTFF